MAGRINVFARWVAAAVLLIAATSSAHAEKRVALVVGNSAYQHARTLANPGNDANDVAGILKNQGFEVLLATDLDQQDFARTIEKFARILDEAEAFVWARALLVTEDALELLQRRAS